MATAAQSLPQPSGALTWLREFLKEELAPYPGRGALVARMTVAATLVMLITMTCRIPYGAYGSIYALTISRENPVMTAKAVKTIIFAFALSVIYVLVGAMFFLQDPDLRLFWVIATLFVVFYFLSAAANYTAAARFGYLLVITIPPWDSQLLPQVKVEQTLWAFAAISLASLITIAIELIYAELNPQDMFLQPVVDRLAAVEELLAAYAAGSAPDKKTEKQITHLALAGSSALRRTLERSAYSEQYREQMGALVAVVVRVVDVAANRIQFAVNIPETTRSRVSSLAANIAKIRSDLLAGRVPRLEVNGETETLQSVPFLGEMEATVSLIPEIFAGSVSLEAYAPGRPSGGPAFSLFKPDALSNPEHFKFGLKGCLAASLCYVFYNAKDWPGISTAITTCLLTALSTIGSSRQKQILRIGGAIVGGVIMGIGAEMYILPALDTITGFTLVFIAATVIASWFATSSPRLSYFGVQIAVAFYLINLSEFHVRTSLIPARDRVLGILLGLMMMWLVFDQLWGASAVVEMRKTFISNLRLLAQFAREPLSNDLKVAIARSYSLRETINSNFEKVKSLADAVLLEFGSSRDQDLAFRDRVRQWQPTVRTLFLLEIATWKYRVPLPAFELPKDLVPEQRAFDEQLAKGLEAIADRMEGRSAEHPDLENWIAPLEQAVQTYPPPEPQQIMAARYQTFLSLLRRIQSLTMSLSQGI
jgi:multidrug resistance protein MdtO